MGQQTRIRYYICGALSLIYSDVVLSEKTFDLKEEDVKTSGEVSTKEVSGGLEDIVYEKDLGLLGSRNEKANEKTQDLLFTKSDNLMDHFVSSGGTPFTPSEIFGITVSTSGFDAKAREDSKREQEWLAKLIEAYLQRFPK